MSKPIPISILYDLQWPGHKLSLHDMDLPVTGSAWDLPLPIPKDVGQNHKIQDVRVLVCNGCFG